MTMAALAVLPAAGAGQSLGSGESGRRTLLPPAEEIALARSAAHPEVSDSAEVWVLGAGGFELAERGTNGVACIVARDWLASLEPICYDPEAAASIMRIGMRRTELLHAGRPVQEVDAVVSAELTSGALRLPRRPAMAYMLSAGQKLINEEGRPVGRWQPHLMLYYPYLTAADLGLRGEGDPRTVIVSDNGAATSVMILIVRDFVEPRITPESR
ncbi:MAG: hypothetical protein L0271_02860 [Gemmatimonadetes bacterium]|nr:hypothetical protein [Gemmatimonadota bacterium]